MRVKLRVLSAPYQPLVGLLVLGTPQNAAATRESQAFCRVATADGSRGLQPTVVSATPPSPTMSSRSDEGTAPTTASRRRVSAAGPGSGVATRHAQGVMIIFSGCYPWAEAHGYLPASLRDDNMMGEDMFASASVCAKRLGVRRQAKRDAAFASRTARRGQRAFFTASKAVSPRQGGCPCLSATALQDAGASLAGSSSNDMELSS